MSSTAIHVQPAWLTWLARAALAGTMPLLAVAILLSSEQMAALRAAWPWLGLKIDQLEKLWPAVDMVHVVMFSGLGVLLVLAFPAVRLRALYLVIAVLAVLTEFVQIWIPGRTPSVGEVLLDLAAGVVGMGVAWLFCRRAGVETVCGDALRQGAAASFPGQPARVPAILRARAAFRDCLH